MTTRAAVVIAALAVLSLPGCAGAKPQSEVPPPLGNGIPELVWIAGIDGAPEDSVLRSAFDRGLKQALDLELLRTESVKRGAITLPVENRFRQLFGNSGEGAWQVHVTITGVPDGRTERRPVADVTLFVHSPAMIAANARPLPVRWRLTAAKAPASAAGYSESLGRAVALLALEKMHELQQTLPPGQRLEVPGFERRSAPNRDSGGGR